VKNNTGDKGRTFYRFWQKPISSLGGIPGSPVNNQRFFCFLLKRVNRWVVVSYNKNWLKQKHNTKKGGHLSCQDRGGSQVTILTRMGSQRCKKFVRSFVVLCATFGKGYLHWQTCLQRTRPPCTSCHSCGRQIRKFWQPTQMA